MRQWVCEGFLTTAMAAVLGVTYGVLTTGCTGPPGQRDNTGDVTCHSWHNRLRVWFSLVPGLPAARILRGVLHWCSRGVQFLPGADRGDVFYFRNSRVDSNLRDLEGARVGLALEPDPSNRRDSVGWFWCTDGCFCSGAFDWNLWTNSGFPWIILCPNVLRTNILPEKLHNSACCCYVVRSANSSCALSVW